MNFGPSDFNPTTCNHPSELNPEKAETHHFGVFSFKNFHPKTSHQILRHMYEALNVDETKKLIAQFTVKSRDEFFKHN
jgi:hypothetical protein